MVRKTLSWQTIVLTLGVGFLGCGCVTTKVRSFVDPGFHDRTYCRLMIQAQSKYLDERDQIETQYAKALEKTTAQAVPSVELLPPTRKFSPEEVDAVVKKEGIDGILVVNQTQYHEDREFIQPNRSAYSYETYAGHYVDLYEYNCGCSYYETEVHLRHEIILYDAKTRHVAWIGGAFTAGDDAKNVKGIYRSLANATVKAMIADGVVESAKHDGN